MLPFGSVPRQYAHVSGAPWPSDPGETLVRSGVLAITVSRTEWRSARGRHLASILPLARVCAAIPVGERLAACGGRFEHLQLART
jgi:hypothetical protein